MLKRIRLIIVLLVLAAVAIGLYKPMAIFAFHIAEPKFLYPVVTQAAEIRNDGYGEGAFGTKRSGGRIHLGVDLKAPIGAPVRAAKSGLAVAKENRGMGKFVEIRHVDGSKTIYGHLSKTFVDARGEKVKRGDIIGEVGKTGNARNQIILPHLHFEVWMDDEPVDPLAGYTQAK